MDSEIGGNMEEKKYIYITNEKKILLSGYYQKLLDQYKKEIDIQENAIALRTLLQESSVHNNKIKQQELVKYLLLRKYEE